MSIPVSVLTSRAPSVLAWTIALAVASVAAAQDPEVRSFDAVRGVPVANAHGDIGELADLVIKLPSDRLCSAVVALRTTKGERLVEVPYRDLEWDGKTNRLLLELTDAELRGLDTFDPVRDVRLRRAVPKKKEEGDGEEQREQAKEKPARQAKLPAALNGSMRVSALAACALRYHGGKTSTVRGAAVELSTGTLVFLLVSDVPGRAGDAELHPVPWATCQVVATRAEPKKAPSPVVQLRASRERVAEAPSLVEIPLNDPLYRARVYEFFGVPKPAFEAAH